MLLLNFAHPLTTIQREQIARLLGTIPEERDIPVQINQAQPLASQIVTLANAAGLSPTEWQTTPLVINPPGLAIVTALLLAELHGRSGGFPTMIRIRPIPERTPTTYEVAEVINLQAVREAGRIRR
ncbi:MAG: hypothetical protein HGA45_09435 [Chloroflexales bacterium]|nr:hypothetical protein [Chloroflexales bacterium]